MANNGGRKKPARSLLEKRRDKRAKRAKQAVRNRKRAMLERTG